MKKLFFIIFGLLAAGYVLYPAGIRAVRYVEDIVEPTYRADRLFKQQADPAVYHLAQKIERHQKIRAGEVAALPQGALNARYGAEITLLFHALTNFNLQAVDVLLGAGADTSMVARPSREEKSLKETGRGRRSPNFVYILGMPGASEGKPGDVNFINSLIRLYLKHGGDPNVRVGSLKAPLIYEVAIAGNYDGIRILVEAGADVWASGGTGSAMSVIAHGGSGYKILNELIDRGYFDKVPDKALKRFMMSLSGYYQRGDKRSLDNQAIGRRVLRRHPEYQEDRLTKRLFQGPIPWKQIQDER